MRDNGGRQRRGTFRPVIGIGASAGGLEALQTFLSTVSGASGATFVIVQHLSPDQKSILHELLQARTDLPVTQVVDGEPVRPDHVYVAPPGKVVTLDGRSFRLDDREVGGEPHRPIDTFLKSLAADRGRDAYCVILSGTGSDGSEGLRAVKAAGGFALVQESAGARFPGMPDAAVATGLVDFVLPVEQIARRLDEIIHHRGAIQTVDAQAALQEAIADALPRIATALAGATGHDFSDYKPGTLVRRIERRMTLLRIRGVDRFASLIEVDGDEARHLAQEFLIGVTQFFRDADAFEALRTQVVLPLLDRSDDRVRVWVPGCSTGEEAYSLAILFLEELRRRGDRRTLQVFGTDIDVPSLVSARYGLFSASAVESLDEARRDAFFQSENAEWRAVPELRECCVFAPHNLVQDPPFSRLDLISCRNLMIYLSAGLQQSVIPKFHFSLKSDGHLFLGPSEGVAGNEGMFHVVEKTHRIFRKNPEAKPSYSSLSEPTRRPRAVPSLRLQAGPPVPDAAAEVSREARVEREFLARHAPPFALISATGEVLYLSTAMTAFVRPAQGTPSTSIDAYLLPELRVPVRSALAQAIEAEGAVTVENVAVPGDATRLYDIELSRMRGDFLLVVKDVRASDPDALDDVMEQRDATDRDILATENGRLRRQLAVTLQEYDTSSQELKSTNEELMSMNEELQSSNEELETSREELQSINEELETVNAELQENNRQLTRVNSDLKNLFESTDLAILFLDREMCVRNFTPPTSDIFGIRPRDVGRPIRDLSSRIGYPELVADAHEVDRTLRPVEREVRVDVSDETFLLRMKPYRTTDDRLDGYVLSFIDITERKRYERTLQDNEHALARQYAELENLYDTAPVGLSLIDRDMRWVRINATLAEINGFPVADHIGRRLDELLPDLDGKLAGVYEQVFATGEPVLGHEIDGETHAQPGEVRNWIGDFYPVHNDGRVFAVGACVREVTDQHRMIERIVTQNERQTLLMGELQHRVKNTLATIAAISRSLLKGADDPATYQRRLGERLNAMSRTHDLLTDADWTTATFQDIVASEARPYESVPGARIAVRGPVLQLTSRQAIAIGMAVHELMTNAAKHGALSAEGGRIEVSTAWDRTGEGGRMRFAWREVGGPRIEAPPERTGFGSVVVERVLASDLGGEVRTHFAPDGFRLDVAFEGGG